MLWKNISPLEPAEKASHLSLHMADVARKVCLAVGRDVVGNIDGVEQILNILRNRFAPDKADCIFQDIAKFLYFKRTTQDADTYLLEFDMLRQRAEARFAMGTGFPDEFASVLCMQNASLTKNETVGNSKCWIAADVCERVAKYGSSQNMDALAAQDMDNVSDEENFEA